MADKEERIKRELLALIPDELTLNLKNLCDEGEAFVIDGTIKESIDLGAFARHSLDCDQCQVAVLRSFGSLVEAVRPKIPKLLMLAMTKGGFTDE